MKVAIPTNDKKNISAHFGRTKGFLIVDIENGNIVNEEYIPNTITGHAQHPHDIEHSQPHSHEHNHSIDTHEQVAQQFANIDVVIAGGMGYGMKSRFESANIRTIITSEKDIKTALEHFINGTLKNEENLTCHHH
ncbi:MAG TPA: NifB/NifX family molybdenum-iron cluster-binding protein [Candidatus Hydrogenedens sp.]|nr:NifB/NifX family molybdenum-iron cluster-binding protein [Candidatus Hydrogenedens sp.]